jgi:hypothetical protein
MTLAKSALSTQTDNNPIIAVTATARKFSEKIELIENISLNATSFFVISANKTIIPAIAAINRTVYKELSPAPFNSPAQKSPVRRSNPEVELSLENKLVLVFMVIVLMILVNIVTTVMMTKLTSGNIMAPTKVLGGLSKNDFGLVNSVIIVSRYPSVDPPEYELVGVWTTGLGTGAGAAIGCVVGTDV